MISFISTRSWTDAPDRQRLIGHALRSELQAVAAQAVPDHMIDLLHQADARWLAATGRDISFTGSAAPSSSLTVAMAIVGTAIGIWVLYDLVCMASSNPALIAITAFLALLAAIVTGTVWLIEAK
jgi:hypothetical protein